MFIGRSVERYIKRAVSGEEVDASQESILKYLLIFVLLWILLETELLTSQFQASPESILGIVFKLVGVGVWARDECILPRGIPGSPKSFQIRSTAR